MSSIQLFIACTIDGFIARENGSLDWLFELENPNRTDHGYNDFISGIDTLVMGRKTYEALLGLVDEWPYPNCKTYVVTHKTSFEITTASTSVLHEVNEEVINDLMNRSSKNIWLVGGGELITCFVNLGAIDEMIISIIPIILGKGIRLFTGIPVETNYELVNTESFETGVVNLKYKKKQK